MAASKLQKQIRNELKKSPGKAIALASLALVAAYFWGDLLMSDESQAPSPDAAMALSGTAVPAAPSASAGQVAPAPVATEWRQIATWIEQDIHMRPAELTTTERDPFVLQVAVEEPAAEEAPAEVEAEPAELFDPEELGLVLTSTAVGHGRAAALINGRAYVEGRTITTQDGQQFRVSRVLPKRVVLERGGKQFELTLAKREQDDSGDGLP